MQPTENYAVFVMARQMSRTVRELLTGRGGMTALEYYLWGRFYTAEKRIQQQQKQQRKR